MSDDQKFNAPVTVFTDPAGGQTTITDIPSCSHFLLRQWPTKRGDKRQSALQACSDVSSGKRPPEIARRAFVAAAREAGILVSA